jgi:glycosyltransferase involved in cell wall biosynthesis
MRILYLSRWFPYPPNNGSKLRTYNLLTGLAKAHEVSLLSFDDQSGAQVNSPEIQNICKEVQTAPWKAYQPNSRVAQLGFLSPIPRSIRDTFSAEMAARIQETLSRHPFDLIIASSLGTACYSRYFRGFPALFEEVEVGVFYDRYISAQTLKGKFRDGLTFTKHMNYLARIMRNFKVCTVVSNREKEIISKLITDYSSIEVIPNCINLADYRDISADPQPETLIFSGPFRYSANYDAMVWFIQEVFPLIQKGAPSARLLITGDHCDLPLPRAKNVVLTGYVEDIRTLIASASISLAPIRVGGGTRLKILEAMALHTPVVATSKGAEGLDIQPEQHLLIADTPERFAEKVLCLLRDQNLADHIKINAYQLVREKYDLAAVIPHFLSIVQRAAQA